MRSKRERLRGSSLYLVLDKRSLKSRSPRKAAEAAIKGGVDIIQIRDKRSAAKRILVYGREIKNLTRGTGVLLIINDRVDICEALDADGVHLGQEDMPAREAREILGKNKIIGVSCHSLREAEKADKEKIDYIAVGPVFKSPTKPELKPKGLKLLGRIKKRVSRQVVAVGGIDASNVAKVLAGGVRTFAVTSAVLKEKDIRAAASGLRRLAIAVRRRNDTTGIR